MVQSCALNAANKRCIQHEWIRDHAIKGRKSILNESRHNSYIVSANTLNGPVTPKIVKGWLEKTEKMRPHSPVLKTISMVPHVRPVRT